LFKNDLGSKGFLNHFAMQINEKKLIDYSIYAFEALSTCINLGLFPESIPTGTEGVIELLIISLRCVKTHIEDDD